jgi:flavin-dependent dehydrogenase
VPAFDFDVAIVGAGPAGSTTALSLLQARPDLRGRVVLLEKARFPREKPCAGALGARGDVLLAGLDVAVDVPSAWVDGITLRVAAGEASASPGRIGRVVRRVEFDHALARKAVSRGAALRDGTRVDDVVDEGPAGAVVATSAGPLRVRAVVGSDGVGSLVRKKLGQGPGRLRAQVVEVDTEPVPGDRDRSMLVFDASDLSLSGYAWDFPTIVDGRPLVSRGVYRLKIDGEAGDDGVDVATKLERRLRAQGIDPSACKNKRYAERGFEPATRVAEGALMLAGEAAGIDPVTGEGIAQALEYGVLAGRFLGERLGGDAAVRTDAWNDALRGSRLARDLRIRTRFVRLFYGPDRAVIERLLTASSDPLRVGCQHFADQPCDWLKVGEVVAAGAAGLLARRLGTALGGRDSR